jgi:hypothetical protein
MEKWCQALIKNVPGTIIENVPGTISQTGTISQKPSLSIANNEITKSCSFAATKNKIASNFCLFYI